MPAAMYAILAEHASDAETLACIVKRHFGDDRLPIRSKKGYNGGDKLLGKGSKDVKLWFSRGIRRFIICHDADTDDPVEIRRRIVKEIVKKSKITENDCCIAIPVREIEAWLIADETAVSQVLPSLKIKSHSSPEAIPDPKQWLIDESKGRNNRPLYAPKTFNPRVAEHLRFEIVRKKCQSFEAFLSCLDRWRQS